MNTPPQRLTRSRSERMIAGVSGGIAHYLAIDPLFVRLTFVFITFSGVGPLVYLVFWLIMPLEPAKPTAPPRGTPAPPPPHYTAARPDNDPRQAFFSGESYRAHYHPMSGHTPGSEQEIPIHNFAPTPDNANNAPSGKRAWTLGIVLIVVGTFLLLGKILPWLHPFIIPIMFIGLGVFLLMRDRRNREP